MDSDLKPNLVVMRAVLDNRLPTMQFPGLPTCHDRVCAAVAYLLAHPEVYLTDGGCVDGNYEQNLQALTGGTDESTLTEVSLAAGLHMRSADNGAITLTPPSEVLPELPDATVHLLNKTPVETWRITREDLTRARRFMNVLQSGSPGTRQALYLMLSGEFERGI